MSDPKHFRDRADELLALVEEFHDFDSRRMMVQMAADYRLLAIKIEQGFLSPRIPNDNSRPPLTVVSQPPKKD